MKDWNEWFENVKWSGECLRCLEENGGKCPDKVCAAFNYSENGDKIPLEQVPQIGNTIDKYRNIKVSEMDDMTLAKVNDILSGTTAFIYEKNGKYAWMAIMAEADGFDTVSEAYLDACAYLEGGY